MIVTFIGQFRAWKPDYWKIDPTGYPANRVHSSFPILASSMLEAFSPLTGFHASLGCVNVNGLTRFYRVRGHRHFRGGRLKYPPKSDQAERSSNGKKTRTLWTVNWIDVKTRRKRKEEVDRYWRIRRKIIEDEMKGRIRSLSHDDSYISWLTILFYTFFFYIFSINFVISISLLCEYNDFIYCCTNVRGMIRIFEAY